MPSSLSSSRPPGAEGSRHSEAGRRPEPGIQTLDHVELDSRFASASLRRPGMTPIDIDGSCQDNGAGSRSAVYRSSIESG
jgi:hypothetical protein